MKKSIALIVEGYEEESYLARLISFNIFAKDNEIKIINAKGVGNIFSRYQNAYQSNRYDEIYAFCDGDNCSSTILELRKRINEDLYGEDDNESTNHIIFANPVTLQIVLMHFKYIILKNVGKKSNASIIEELTGIKNYKANDDQIDEMMNLIKYSSYEVMKANLEKLSSDISVIPSTNFLYLLSVLEKID